MNQSIDFAIRKGEMRDADQLAAFNILMAKETENIGLDPNVALRGVKAILKDPHKGFYLVAAARQQIIGQLMVTNEWSDWRNAYFWWIQSVYVDPDFRDQRIFSSLFSYLKELASLKKNVTGLRLYVDSHNEQAKGVYESLGMLKSNYELFETDLV